MTIPEIEAIYARDQGMLSFAKAIESQVIEECKYRLSEEYNLMTVAGEGLTLDQGLRLIRSLNKNEKEKAG